jgi:hypothetical protein
MKKDRLLEKQEDIFEREMCPWAISKYFGDLVSNTSAYVLNGGQSTNQV